MYAGLWMRIVEETEQGSWDVLVIDEFMAAYRYGLIDRDESLRFLRGETGISGSRPDRAGSGPVSCGTGRLCIGDPQGKTSL